MNSHDVVIVGSGFGGLGMGRQLLKAGIQDFVILEKDDEIGGTWRDNTYPGAECDVPSFLYSYSFAHNPDWQHKWSKQEQIFAYEKKCAEEFGLQSHIRTGQSVCSAEYDEQRLRWRVGTKGGEVYDCRHFICAVGQLHVPNTPKVEGQEEFEGTQFHSAKWQHDVELSGKKVAVIGNAASALQFIPHVAEEARKLAVYQRSANWVLPKGNRPYSAFEKWISKKAPLLAKIYRFGVWLRQELLVYPMAKGSALQQGIGTKMFHKNLERTVSDPELRAKLTPDYPIGAKRILVSDTLFPALTRDNVEVVTDGVANFAGTGIVDSKGVEREHDVVIYGTGFETNPFLASIAVSGKNGLQLTEAWRDGARAFLGVSVPDFPNLHILYGPNTNTGHTSVVFMLEAQFEMVLQLIKNAGDGSAEVRSEVADRFDAEMQHRLKNTEWDKVELSWYKDGDRITNNWPGSSWEYSRRTRNTRPDDFIYSSAAI